MTMNIRWGNSLEMLADDLLGKLGQNKVGMEEIYAKRDGIGSNTQLILLGDKDRLSSVDPGSVMAELCQSSMLAPCVTVLDKNQRAKDAPSSSRSARP